MLAVHDESSHAMARQGLPHLEMRIGVATGRAVVGELGDAARTEFAVLGDVVNTAARLEAANKQLGTRLLISLTTADAVGTSVALEPVGELSLKGKSRPERVFTLPRPQETAAGDR